MKSGYFLNLALEEQNSILQSILESLPHVVFLFDVKEKKNLFINKSVFENIGYSIDEIHSLGNNVLQEIIHPDDYEEITDFFQNVSEFKNNTNRVHLNRWKDKKGEYHWFKNHVTPFAKSNSDSINNVVLAISKNITPELTSQSMILEQIKSIEKISFTLSHELRHEHSKILGVINLSQQNDVILTFEELQMLSNTIFQSAEKVDMSIKEINTQLYNLKKEFIAINAQVNLENA